jgi:serine/threonine-protein kinase PRP4
MASPAASSDEGEIIEADNRVGSEGSKATTLHQIYGNGVDRPDRTRVRYSRSRSPDYDGPGSRRSRSPRGFKRPRDDRDHHRSGRQMTGDPRQFRVHYEDTRHDPRRSRFSYDDDDRPPSRGASGSSFLRYGDRDRTRDRNRSREHSRDRDRARDRDGYPDKRPRNRTRSPYRPPRPGGRDRADRSKRDNDYDRPSMDRDLGRNGKRTRGESPRRLRDHHVSFKRASPETNGARKDAKSTKRYSDESSSAGAHPRDPEPEPYVEEEQPLDVDAEIERRRKRREELLAKSRGPTPMLVQALQASEKTALGSPAHTQNSTPAVTEANTPRSGKLYTPKL